MDRPTLGAEYPDFDFQDGEFTITDKDQKGAAPYFIGLLTGVEDPDLSKYQIGTRLVNCVGQLGTLDHMKYGAGPEITRVDILSKDKLLYQIMCTHCKARILTTSNKSWTSLPCPTCSIVLFFHPKQYPKKKEWLKFFFKSKSCKEPANKKIKFENDFPKAKRYAKNCFILYNHIKKTSYAYNIYFKEYLQKLAILLRCCDEMRDIFLPSKTHWSVITYLQYFFLEYDYLEGQVDYNSQNIFFYKDYQQQQCRRRGELAPLMFQEEFCDVVITFDKNKW